MLEEIIKTFWQPIRAFGQNIRALANRLLSVGFVKDNRLSLVYVFPKKKVTYLGGQIGDQAWKFSRHWVEAGHIGDPTGRNVKPWVM